MEKQPPSSWQSDLAMVTPRKTERDSLSVTEIRTNHTWKATYAFGGNTCEEDVGDLGHTHTMLHAEPLGACVARSRSRTKAIQTCQIVEAMNTKRTPYDRNIEQDLNTISFLQREAETMNLTASGPTFANIEQIAALVKEQKDARLRVTRFGAEYLQIRHHDVSLRMHTGFEHTRLRTADERAKTRVSE